VVELDWDIAIVEELWDVVVVGPDEEVVRVEELWEVIVMVEEPDEDGIDSEEPDTEGLS
jgi:hypothetical protein